MIVTNIVVDKHNAWTLTKHVANSLNKAAAKVDGAVYGTTTNVQLKTIQEVKPQESSGFGDILKGIGAVIILVILFVAFASGAIKGRDLISF